MIGRIIFLVCAVICAIAYYFINKELEIGLIIATMSVGALVFNKYTDPMLYPLQTEPDNQVSDWISIPVKIESGIFIVLLELGVRAGGPSKEAILETFTSEEYWNAVFSGYKEILSVPNTDALNAILNRIIRDKMESFNGVGISRANKVIITLKESSLLLTDTSSIP